MNFIKKNISYIIICSVLFLIFASQNRFYGPSRVEISGRYSSPSQVRLSWRTGEERLGNVSVKLGSRPDGAEYRATDSLDVPQLKLREVTIEEAGGTPFEIESIRVFSGGELLYDVPDRYLPIRIHQYYRHTRSFHPVLVSVQIALSIIITYILYLAKRYISGGVRKRLFEEKGYVFLILFLFFAASFSFWLVGQWPGASNMDSFDVLRQVRTFNFHRWHTLVYPLYVLALSQFSPSPASVSIFQILASSMLGAYILFRCWRQGLNIIVVAVFAVLFAASVPIGLYNIYLMKDVPFALLAVLLASLTFFLFYRKTYLNEKTDWSLARLLGLSAILVALASVRHNGVVYMAALPPLFYFGKIMEMRKAVLFVAVSVVMYAFVQLALPRLMINKEVAFPRIEAVNMTLQVNPLTSIMKSPWYYTEDTDKDRKIIGKLMDFEKLRQTYVPHSADFILFNPDFKGWYLSKEDYSEVQDLYFRLTLNNLPLFISERAYVFMAALGLPVSQWTEGLYHNNWEDMDRYGSAFTILSDIAFSPISKGIYGLQVKMLKKTGVMYRLNGKEFWLGLRLLVWNGLIPLFVLVCIAVAYKFVPCSALASLVVLIQAPFLFFLIAGSPFRFIYFIYYFGYFIIPLLLLEIAGKRRVRDGLK
ncbi:MAG: hypothetical protein HY954_05180 [Deltaproteobacteria bacterium]|nr:hypothetical protein [Deltaproteobacteria bacterium]